MKMTNSNIEESIKRGVSVMTPDDRDIIWEKREARANGSEWYLEGTTPKKKSTGKVISLMSAIAACCVICFLSLYMTTLHADTTIYLDVNPSVELQVNRNEKVIAADASNEDGITILENMDLKNTDLDIAVNALLGSMVKHGYLSEAKNVILLSVESRNTQRADRIRGELTTQINDCLNQLIGSGLVLNQSVEVDSELEKLSEQYGITPGKASLLRKIIEKHPELEYSRLARMSMTDLTSYLAGEEVDLESMIHHSESEAEDAEEESKEAEDEKSKEVDTDIEENLENKEADEEVEEKEDPEKPGKEKDEEADEPEGESVSDSILESNSSSESGSTGIEEEKIEAE